MSEAFPYRLLVGVSAVLESRRVGWHAGGLEERGHSLTLPRCPAAQH